MLLSPAGTDTSLPSIWDKLRKGNRENEKALQHPSMAVSRPRLLTLVYEDKETLRMLPNSYADLEAVARDWVKPPPDATFALRIPIEYASYQASRLINGPYIWVDSEESYQIATLGVQGSRVEISSDAPPPPPEEAPPPDPILEMDGIFNLELAKGHHIGMDVTITSDELDMARLEDGTTVDGTFWGKLDIVHNGGEHKMEFSGTRVQDPNYSSDFMFDSRVMTKLTAAAKPATAKCSIAIFAPAGSMQYCEINLSTNPMWKVGTTWPPAENQTENTFKYFLRVHPGGALEHFETETVTTTVYYEVMPDPLSMDPTAYVAPYNSFAMSIREFLPHISKIFEQLGATLQARTHFLTSHMSAFSAHKNIAYRLMPPSRLKAAIKLDVSAVSCVTRLFMMFRGISDEEMADFAAAGEKEAINQNWREILEWSDITKDRQAFRAFEMSILEVA